jgi:hypothetical protein
MTPMKKQTLRKNTLKRTVKKSLMLISNSIHKNKKDLKSLLQRKYKIQRKLKLRKLLLDKEGKMEGI